jgi:hypothetical protein
VSGEGRAAVEHGACALHREERRAQWSLASGASPELAGEAACCPFLWHPLPPSASRALSASLAQSRGGWLQPLLRAIVFLLNTPKFKFIWVLHHVWLLLETRRVRRDSGERGWEAGGVEAPFPSPSCH